MHFTRMIQQKNMTFFKLTEIRKFFELAFGNTVGKIIGMAIVFQNFLPV